MNQSPSHEDIIQALNQSGYLMEQQVATQLEALGLHVWTNWAFEDIDEGKSREIDVRAFKSVARNEKAKVSAFVEIIVECKNSSNPLVFLGRPKSEVDDRNAPEELVFPIDGYREARILEGNRAQYRRREAFFHLGFDKVHYRFTSRTKAVQFCRIDRNGKNWQANHGGLYNSIFYPMAKAVTAKKREIQKATRPAGGWRYFWFIIPILVTSGDIFFVDSTLDAPVPVERNFVTFQREIKSENLAGKFAIDFVRQSYLEQFYEDCLRPLILRMVDLSTNHSGFVLNEDIPWE